MSTLYFRMYLTMLLCGVGYSFAMAGTGSPGKPFRLYSPVILAKAVSDTVPSPNQPVVQPAAENKEKKDIIKEVPKSRRQSKPVIVSPRIKTPPVKIIKPKIIRRSGIL